MVRLLLALCLLGCSAPSTQRTTSSTATTYSQLDSLLHAGVSTITLRGTIDASGRPPLTVTRDGVTIKGGRIVSGSFYSGGESMNAALIVTASDVTISGVTFVGPSDNPYTQRSKMQREMVAVVVSEIDPAQMPYPYPAPRAPMNVQLSTSEPPHLRSHNAHLCAL
jgi:hypothetical protein